MSIKLEKAEKRDFKLVKPLFISAFPKEERPPFFMMKRGVKKANGDLLIVRDGEKFVGFAYLMAGKRAAYLFFLAISDDCRNKGYGSEVLAGLKEAYPDKSIFLAREMLDESAENYTDRVRRHGFYLRNGFIDLVVKIKEGSVIYDVMGTGAVEPSDYEEIMRTWCGKLYCKLVDLRMFGN